VGGYASSQAGNADKNREGCCGLRVAFSAEDGRVNVDTSRGERVMAGVALKGRKIASAPRIRGSPNTEPVSLPQQCGKVVWGGSRRRMTLPITGPVNTQCATH
jgi:hypothetical protein